MFLPGPNLQAGRGSRAPCPSGNGTMIGGEQQFVVYCDTRFRGDELFRQTVDSLATCTELCTSFQNPRCEGAQFRNDNNDCVLIGNVIPEGTRPSRTLDSAAAIFPQPGPTSSCSQQGTGTTFLSQNSSYTLRCGEIVNGQDLAQTFQTTFESCLAACSANPACGGLSYDPLQSNGFKNCYLKTAAVDDSDVFAKSGVDSAVLANSGASGGANTNGNQAAETSGTGTVVIGTPAAADSGTTVFVTAVPDPGTGSSGGSGVVTVSVPVSVPAMSTSSSSSGGSSSSALADSTPEASTAAASADTGDGGGRGGLGGSGRPRFGNVGPSTSSNAWIAAPVIGGIAALTLILAVFVLWGRRRRRDNNNNHNNGNNGNNSSSSSSRSSRALGGFGRGLGDAASRMSHGRLFGQEKTKLGVGDSDLDYDDESHYGKKKNNNSSSNSNNNNRGGFKVVSGSGRRLGLQGQQEISGTGPGLGGMMIVTTGGGRIVETNPTGAGGGGGGGVRSNSPTGSAGLRDSQNGLRQNRLTGNWLESQPGIPAEFRGPDFK